MNAKNVIIVALAMLFAIAAASKSQESPVHFDDIALKAAVEEALGITDPTPTNMLGLTVLDAKERGIVDLTGLEYATNLTWLELHINQISDISAVAGLTNLTNLYLHDCQISDISAIAGLTQIYR